MKQKLLIPFAGLFVTGLLLAPSVGMAQFTASTTSTSSGQASSPQATTVQINSLTALLQQIQSLQNQLRALQAQTATEFGTFLTTLSLGSKGDAVLALQALLAANPDIYPEGLITGHFGKATEKALKRFQKANGLEQAGRVGPKTLKLLNKLLENNRLAFEDDDDDSDNNRGRGKRVCANIPPGHLVAPGWLRKHDGIKPLVPECQKLPKGIEDRGDDDNDDDDDDDDDDDNSNSGHGSSPADVTAPIISDLSATNIASTSASIVWSTNEKTSSSLWYGTTTPLNTSSATRLGNNSLETSHSYSLSGLTPSTTYYIIVKVSDKSNNTSTSIEQLFTTLVN